MGKKWFQAQKILIFKSGVSNKEIRLEVQKVSIHSIKKIDILVALRVWLERKI